MALKAAFYRKAEGYYIHRPCEHMLFFAQLDWIDIQAEGQMANLIRLHHFHEVIAIVQNGDRPAALKFENFAFKSALFCL